MPIRAISLVFLTVTACANAPARIYDMDETAIRRVPDNDLCFAVALALKRHRPASASHFEMQRRGITCDAEIAENVSNCTELAIINPNQEPVLVQRGGYRAYTAKFEVRNNGSSPVNFRIAWRDSPSRLLNIAARTKGMFDVEAGVGSPVGPNGQLKPTGAVTYDCTVAGASTKDVRW